MSWIVTIIALVGVWLNIRRRWQGFACWLFSNSWWFYHNLTIGEYEQAILYAIFFVMSIIGIYQWHHYKIDGILKSHQQVFLINEIKTFCHRIIKASDDCGPGEKVRINWLEKETQRILGLITKK